MVQEQSELITPAVYDAIDAIRRREIAAPILLFVAAHRPLAFVTGQLLTLGSPIGIMAGWHGISDWAELLSHPNGPSQLEQLLH